jgi:hypothetical protein
LSFAARTRVALLESLLRGDEVASLATVAAAEPLKWKWSKLLRLPFPTSAVCLRGVLSGSFERRPISNFSDLHAAYAECMAAVDTTPVTAAKTAEILSHIRESLLVIRGDTHYCGVIREPTWILIWDSAQAANTWFGG